MKKNIILLVGFICLPAFAYGSSNIARDSLIKNQEEEEDFLEVEEKGVSEILGAVGDILENTGDVVQGVGDDGKESDNKVETAGKHINALGALFKSISKIFKDVCKDVD